MFLLGTFSGPVRVFKSKGIHLYQTAVRAEYLFHVFTYQVQWVQGFVRVAEDPAMSVGCVPFDRDPARLPNHLSEFSRPHQLTMLSAGGCGDAFVNQSAAQVVNPGVQQ